MKQAKLSTSGGTVTVDSEITDLHPSQTFSDRGHLVVMYGGMYAIVFNISNNPPEDPCLKKQIHGKTVLLNAVINNTPYGWKIGDELRIMYFNERNPVDFANASSYFEERLKAFGYRKNVTPAEYKAFTEGYNTTHPGSNIDLYCSGLIPKQTKKDDVLSIV